MRAGRIPAMAVQQSRAAGSAEQPANQRKNAAIGRKGKRRQRRKAGAGDYLILAWVSTRACSTRAHSGS